MCRLRIVTQPAGGLPPVQARHHHVECHHLDVGVFDLVQRVLSVDRRHDVKALELQVDRDQLPDHIVVIDDEDTPGTSHSGEATGTTSTPMIMARALLASACPSPRSSGDRAPPSGGGGAGSNPAGGTNVMSRDRLDTCLATSLHFQACGW